MGIVRTNNGYWIPFWKSEGKKYFDGVCPICNNTSSSGKKKNRCSVFIDDATGEATAISCAYVPSDKLTNCGGDIFYIHSLINSESKYKKYRKKLSQEDIKKLRKQAEKERLKCHEINDLEFRKKSNKYHRYLFKLLITDIDTKNELDRRGLDKSDYKFFKSLPQDFGEKIAIATDMANKFGLCQGITIKTSKKTNKDFLVLNGPSKGFLIPYFDVNNLLYACQVADLSPNPFNKYWWFSSPEQSSHSPYGYWEGDKDCRIVIIIEGGLKGYIAQKLFKKHFGYKPHIISIAGVGNYNRAVEGLNELTKKINISKDHMLVYLAYDMDKFDEANCGKSKFSKLKIKSILSPEMKLHSGLRAEGYSPAILIWDEKLKGLDDFLYEEQSLSSIKFLPYEQDTDKDYFVITDSIYLLPENVGTHIVKIYDNNNVDTQFKQIREYLIYSRKLHNNKPYIKQNYRKVFVTPGAPEVFIPYLKALNIDVTVATIDEYNSTLKVS